MLVFISSRQINDESSDSSEERSSEAAGVVSGDIKTFNTDDEQDLPELVQISTNTEAAVLADIDDENSGDVPGDNLSRSSDELLFGAHIISPHVFELEFDL